MRPVVDAKIVCRPYICLMLLIRKIVCRPYICLMLLIRMALSLPEDCPSGLDEFTDALATELAELCLGDAETLKEQDSKGSFERWDRPVRTKR